MKGTLTLPNGDYIEGSFNGTFSDGVKVNGTFHKSADNVTEIKGFTHALGVIPKLVIAAYVNLVTVDEKIFQLFKTAPVY